MVSLFGGAVIGGTSYVGLERICVAFNVADESFLNKASHSVEVMSQAGDDDSQRVWWRSVHSSGDETWISINPGEFRTEPPEPPCIVKDIPEGTPQVSLRGMLEGAVESCKVLPPFADRESEILDNAKRLLARPSERLPTDLYQSIRSASNIASRQQYQALIDDLYKNYFVGLRCTIADFSLAILFLQLQSALHAFVEQEWREDPWGYLRSYLVHMLRNEETRAKAIETLLSICKSEFAAGRKKLVEALGGTMSAMPRRLMWANHKFFMVKAMLNALEEGSVPRGRIQPDPIVAEEAVACSYTGIHVGADFCIKHPDALVLDLIARCGPDLSELKRRISAQTSEIEPTFTRLFGQILAAQAMTCSANHVRITEGIAELNRLQEHATSGGEEFEWSWLDRALLNAHRRIGNTEVVNALAKRIAVKLLLRKRLGG